MSIHKIVLALAATSFALTGCATDVEGDWQSREKLSNDERNRVSFEADGVGSAKIYAALTADGGLTKFKYDISWEVDGNGDYDVVAKCTSNCVPSVEKFEMECTLGEGDMLDCRAEAPYEGYGYLEFEPMAQ